MLATVALLSSSAGAEERALASVLDELRREVGAPGAILGVRLPKGEWFVVSSGVSDLESERPIRPDDPYYLGSISKSFTAVVTLRLAEEGRLSLDDPLGRFLPAFPGASEISIRQMLQHTTGLKDFYSHLYFRPDRSEMIELVTRSWNETELLELSGRLGRWFSTGEDWEYSSTNYYLLGVVVERATGNSLPSGYRKYISDPLALDDIWLAWHERTERRTFPMRPAGTASASFPWSAADTGPRGTAGSSPATPPDSGTCRRAE